MENLISVAIPVLLAILAVRLLFAPMKWFFKLAVNALGGFASLWLINAAAGFTGLIIPINTVTVMISGVLGVPGIALLALLELF